MKNILTKIISPSFGKKQFKRFYEILKNISYQGLNYRNTNIEKNGELFILEKINQYYKNFPDTVVLFDVGANIGNYSTALYRVFKEKAVIYAFEPFSSPFTNLIQLKKNIPCFYPFKMGFSDREQKLTIFSNKEFSEVGGIYNRDFSRFNIILNETEESVFDEIDNF